MFKSLFKIFLSLAFTLTLFAPVQVFASTRIESTVPTASTTDLSVTVVNSGSLTTGQLVINTDRIVDCDQINASPERLDILVQSGCKLSLTKVTLVQPALAISNQPTYLPKLRMLASRPTLIPAYKVTANTGAGLGLLIPVQFGMLLNNSEQSVFHNQDRNTNTHNDFVGYAQNSFVNIVMRC